MKAKRLCYVALPNTKSYPEPRSKSGIGRAMTRGTGALVEALAEFLLLSSFVGKELLKLFAFGCVGSVLD